MTLNAIEIVVICDTSLVAGDIDIVDWSLSTLRSLSVEGVLSVKINKIYNGVADKCIQIKLLKMYCNSYSLLESFDFVCHNEFTYTVYDLNESTISLHCCNYNEF